jgi:hypothetical protein
VLEGTEHRSSKDDHLRVLSPHWNVTQGPQLLCFPLILRRPVTALTLSHRALPHLNTRETHSDKVRGPVGSSVKSGANNATRSAKDRMHDPLQPRVRAALELHYKEEVEVYRVAKRVHEAQVAYVRSLLAQRTLPSVPMPHHARNPNSNSKML